MMRKATGSDERAIRKCAEQAYARYVPLIGRKPAPMVADFARHIAEGQAYVAVDDRDVIQGFIVFHAESDYVLLENLAVFPHAAGRGIGKALIAYCEDTARKSNLGVVRLYTNEKMTENISIYRRLGYSEVERRKEDGFSRVYFVKHLD